MRVDRPIVSGKFRRRGGHRLVYTDRKDCVPPVFGEARAKNKAEEREKRKTEKDLEIDNSSGQRMNKTSAAVNRPIVSGKFRRREHPLVYTDSKDWVPPIFGEARAEKKAEGREKRKTGKDLEIDNGGGQRMYKTSAAVSRSIVSGKFRRRGHRLVYIDRKDWVPPVFGGARAKKKAEERQKRKTDKDLEIDNGGGQRMNKTSAAVNRPGKFDECNKFTSKTMGILRGHVCPRQESKNLDSNYVNKDDAWWAKADMLFPTLGPKRLSSGKPGRDQHSLGIKHFCSIRKRKRPVASLG